MTFVERLLDRMLRSRRFVLGIALVAGLACGIVASGHRADAPSPIAAAQASEPIVLAAEPATAETPAAQPKAEAPAKARGMDAEIRIGGGGGATRKPGRDEPRLKVG